MSPSPLFPFVIYGVITDLDGSTVASNSKVTILNKTQGGSTSMLSVSNGEYTLDMANTERAVMVGDVLSIKVVSSNKAKARIVEVTATADHVDRGGFEQDLSLYGMRKYTWDRLKNVYENNLPPNFTDLDGSSSVAWSFTATFPEKNPVFPVIILHPVEVDEAFMDMSHSDPSDTELSVRAEFYVQAKHKTQRFDEARDFLRDVIDNNKAQLRYEGLFFPARGWIDDSNMDQLLFDDEKYNFGNHILNLRWNP